MEERNKERFCPICNSDLGFTPYNYEDGDECSRCGWNPKMSPEEENELLESYEMIYDGLERTAGLLRNVISRVIEVGDLETMIALEDLLTEHDEYAWSRDITKEINQMVDDRDWLEDFKEEKDDGR